MTTTPDVDNGSGVGIGCLTDDNPDVDVAIAVDMDLEPAQKPHFLDYDAVPPPEFIDRFMRRSPRDGLDLTNRASSPVSGEQLKLDKKFERDGEISDYELAASGYTKKEFTQDDNTLHLDAGGGASVRKNAFVKPKHFLDENPIPPDYMLEQESREHRSLDRNFERAKELLQRHTPPERTESALSLSGSGGRRSSLDRASSSSSRSSRDRFKEPSYTLSRFLDSESQRLGSPSSLPPYRVPKSGAAWSEGIESPFNSLQIQSEAISAAVLKGGLRDTPDTSAALGPKVECVYSLLSMLGSNDPLEMAKKFHELSRSPETCITLRRSGCIPLLVQIMYSPEGDDTGRRYASMALHNVVHSHPDEKARRREAKVLRLLDQIRDYCNFLKTLLQSGGEAIADDSDRHPLAEMSSLMKVSFDEEHRHSICELGALQGIPNLVHLDYAVHGPRPEDQCCNSLRRYALMALTNLTFGDENNKALLCNQKLFMEALVAQLDAAPDDLLQVTASVLRNLSWRADTNMKAVLNEIGTVTALARAAMKNKSENTLKAILSALWNLSAHCSMNKAEFCSVDGALGFLVDMLTYEGPSKTLKIIESAGGILRNVSSHIAVREDYRQILREHNCLAILLQQLKSESLTVVSNSCGTLWNLSARCPEDQKFLWDNGAVPMLRSLIHSKHAMISEGSSSALKNLLNFRPTIQNQSHLDPIARSMGLKKLPTLNVRKQKALEQELGSKKHAETCDNLDVGLGGDRSKDQSRSNFDNYLATTAQRRYHAPLGSAAMGVGGVVVGPSSAATSSSVRLTRSAMLTKSESRDSVFSAKSDSAYEQLMRSHSASDAYRKKQKNIFGMPPGIHGPRAAFALANDSEPTEAEEHPIDYSVKYKETAIKAEPPESEVTVDGPAYQETDLDQPTDFSLRYAENQVESDGDIMPPPPLPPGGQKDLKEQANSNEILLILEDSVKCYQTEDTPYVISNAASVTDLRPSKTDGTEKPASECCPERPRKKYQRDPAMAQTPSQVVVAYGSGSYTPEKPINYCEEGTPGCFSRYDSLSSLDEPTHASQPPGGRKKSTKEEENTSVSVPNDIAANTKGGRGGSDHVNRLNSAQETPLMFSRRSSMDSLVEEDVGPIDDKSSVVSEFSRLASGVISPSEIPDSPTQSMPQSPRRIGSFGLTTPLTPRSTTAKTPRRLDGEGEGGDGKRPLRSVFEDNLNTFHVENTPAQFSCATSLSNLSIMDDETASPPLKTLSSSVRESDLPQLTENNEDNGNVAGAKVQDKVATAPHLASEGEEEEGEATNDDLLLANCINMGMNRSSCYVGAGADVEKASSMSKAGHQRPSKVVHLPADEAKQYCTEDTPALLSKVGSHTNLSAISMSSSNNIELKEDSMDETAQDGDLTGGGGNRHSLNLSDDISSNASESGAASQSFDILQQCIWEGMKKPSGSVSAASSSQAPPPLVGDPIAMMRRGGGTAWTVPPYLPVSDEMNKYVVEDSPCNFSVVSGLSNLTVGSSLVGPAINLQEASRGKVSPAPQATAGSAVLQRKIEEDGRREPQWQDDSLSSLSIDSEDDTNLLSQAIAAGCNRPKSNLGFSRISSNQRSSSQPIPIINSANSASSLNSTATARHYQRRHQTKHKATTAAGSGSGNGNGNESFSSVDSSDSNDNQSKSLFELCILKGMHKSHEPLNGPRVAAFGRRSGGKSGNGDGGGSSCSTQSNPNLKQQFDSLPMTVNTTHHHHPTTVRHHHTPSRHLRDRDRKDEKLLMECINTGISRRIGDGAARPGISTVGSDRAMGSQVNGPRPRLGGDFSSSANASSANAGPKNVQATSAAARELCHQVAATTYTIVHSTAAAAPDVEKKSSAAINTTSRTSPYNVTESPATGSREIISLSQNHAYSISISPSATTSDGPGNRPRNEAVGGESPQSPGSVHATMNGIGCRPSSGDPESVESSDCSLTLDSSMSQLENGQRPRAPTAVDKRKDPDLMLKSVERLTLEFVSSAEHLRTLSCHQDSSSGNDCTATGNNTWNEDTCPNDVSFPSVSVSRPEVTSLQCDDVDGDEVDALNTEADHGELHDFAEITPTNEERPSQPSVSGGSQPNSLDTETESVVGVDSQSSGINFKLGGEVHSAAATGVTLRRNSFYNNSAMTASAIIAIEARALAENLQQKNCDDDGDDGTADLTFSITSFDLDNIRPPSGMDSLNSGCFADSVAATMGTSQPASLPRSYTPRSPQLAVRSPKFPRKHLPPGLVARRALGHLPSHLTGSAESVNSSCNLLDNIKPPSMMDELLDSMMSVSSIQSEIAEYESLATTVDTLSNYETAAGGSGDLDENTVTLQSCCDALPRDDCDDDVTMNSGDTPLGSDDEFSSVDSTPTRKSPKAEEAAQGKRTLTPKQKRKMSRDRFKTYTITADAMKRSEADEGDPQEDETLKIEIVEASNSSPAAMSVIRRRSSKDRYKTQTIVYPLAKSVSNNVNEQAPQYTSLTSTDDGGSDEMSSIKAMTTRYKFISAPIPGSGGDNETTIGPGRNDPDSNSIECDQSSETESCCGNNETIQHLMGAPVDYQTEDGGKEGDEDLEEEVKDVSVVAADVGPRIMKPGEKMMGAAGEEQTKAILGRKKPTYISPYSMQYRRKQPPTTTTTAITTTLTPQPPIRVTKSKASTGPNAEQRPKQRTATKMTQKKKLTEKGTSPNGPSLERQGTFVQDEPTIGSDKIPIVEMATVAATSAPTSSKSSPTHRASRLPMKRQITSAKVATSSTRKIPTSVGRATNTTSMAVAQAPQRSNSNATIRITTNAARIAVFSSRVSSTMPPSRSNSNINNSAAATATAKAAARINQAQSRIAGIWKRVDEAKAKQQTTQVKRPLQQKALNIGKSPTAQQHQQQQEEQSHRQIKPKAGNPATSSPAVAPKTEKQQRLVRSTTFDSSPSVITIDGVDSHACGPAVAAVKIPIPTTSRIANNRNMARWK